jgi:hypothetical protein
MEKISVICLLCGFLITSCGEISETTEVEILRAEEDIALSTEEDIASSEKEVITTNKEKVITTNKEKVITTNKEKVITPSAEKTITPSAEKVITPSAEKVITPSAEKVITSSTEKTITPNKEKVITSSTEKTITSSTEKTITSSTEKTITSSTEEVITSNTEEAIKKPLLTAPKTRIPNNKWDILKSSLQKSTEDRLLSIPLSQYESYWLSYCISKKEIALLNTRGCPYSTDKEIYESAEYKKDQELCFYEIKLEAKVEEYRNRCIDEHDLKVDKEWLTLKIKKVQEEMNSTNNIN